MKVLITGATGFVGSHLCRRMAMDGQQVRILCRPTSSFASLEKLKLEKVLGDITDAESVRTAVRGCKVVVHAAASLNPRQSEEDRQMRVNVEGTRHVAQAARAEGVERMLHVSSVAAIGISFGPERPANEDFSFNLEDSRWSYHISKHRAEGEVLAEVARDLDAVIVNPAVICGPPASSYRIAEPMKRALAHWVIPCAPGGLCVVHVEDVVEGILLALEKGRIGNRYILGGDNVTFREMCRAVCERLGLRRIILPVPAILAEEKGQAASFLRRVLGGHPLPGYERRYSHQFYDSRKAAVELGFEARNFASIVEEFASVWETRAVRRNSIAADT